MRTTGRSAAALLMAVISIGVLGIGIGAGPAGAVGGCTAAQLVPELREFRVNQGLPSYGTLVPGKDAVVKLYLSLPQCASGTTSTISLKSGSTLGVAGAAATPDLVALNPAAGATAPMVAYGSAPANDATGDPKWAVAGSVLRSASGQVTFTAKVSYVAQLTPVSTPVNSSVTFSQSAVVDTRGNALRVLFVPMGQPATSSQLTTGGNQAVQNGVNTLSRLLPIPAGTAALGAAGSAGLYYAVDGGMLDVSGQFVNGKFCGKPETFATVRDGLTAFLQAWNSNNATAQADRVVGVIDESISDGANAGCYEGAGGIRSSVGWVRALYNSGTPNMTGALMAMELGHTWGATPPGPNSTPTDFNGDSTYHSKNFAADGTAPNRGYNTTTRSFISAPRSATDLNGTWTNDSVLFEPEDFRFTDCVFGGSDTTCGTGANSVGAVAGAQPRFVISGRIHVDPSSGQSFATVNDSYFTADSRTETQPESSRWHVVQLKADGTVLADDGLPVSFQPSVHGAVLPNGQDGTFYSSRPFFAADRVELRDGATVIYSRDRNLAPVITSTGQQSAGGPVLPGPVQDYTATQDTNEGRPALAGNGLLAWSNPAGLVLSRTNDPARQTIAVAGTAGATNPQFNRDSNQLTYEVNGNIDVRTVTWDGSVGGPVVVGAPTRIYNAGPISAFPAHHPTFSPTSDRVAVEYNHNLFVVFLQPGGPLGCVLPGTVLSGSCSQVTSGGLDSDPAWAPTGNTVATARAAGVFGVDTTNGTASLMVPNAAEPAWGGSELAFTRNGNVFLADPSSVVATTQQLTHLGDDGRPTLVWSPAGGRVAFERQLKNPSQSDVMVEALAPNPPTNGQTYTATASDENPALLRAQFLRVCPDGRRNVLAAAVHPNDIDGAEARFQMTYDPASEPSVGCAGGQIVVAVSDGIDQTTSQPGGTVPSGSRQPVVAIASTRPGAQFRAGQVVALQGSGYDADQSVLQPAQLSWTLSGPGGSQTYAATDHVDLVPPPGDYAVTLTGTNGAGQQATTQRSFTVVASNRPTPSITSPATGTSVTTGTAVTVAGAATDAEDGTLPTSALDWSVDGPSGTQTYSHVGQFTYTPTTAGAYAITLVATDSDGNSGTATRTFTATNPPLNASVDFDPNSLNVPPLPSDSQTVTTYAQVAGKDLRQVASSSVKVTKIATFTAANDPLFPNLAATAWSVSGSGSSQTATAKFDRITLANYLQQKGLINRYVPIEISGAAPTWSFAGTDSSAPYVKQSL
ncbi:MAG: putative peptidase [Acidimicrobiales bacterium]|nr:putative peptidase [Acidimicrobiales bacterium]